MLPCILKEAIKGDGGIWALTSIAALVILGDAQIFSHPRSLKIVFDALRYSSRHKTPAVASLHTEVWACLVWALSRSFSIQDGSHVEARKDTYQRAFQLLAQEMRPSVGTRLVAVLVRDHSPTDGQPLRAWNVQQAVAIIKQLMKDPCLQTFHEGYALLHRLVSGVPSSPSASSEPSLSDFVRDTLVNGSCLRMSLPDLEQALKDPHPFPLSYIHALTEAEVQAHWQDLSESWAMAAERLQPTISTEALVCSRHWVYTGFADDLLQTPESVNWNLAIPPSLSSSSYTRPDPPCRIISVRHKNCHPYHKIRIPRCRTRRTFRATGHGSKMVECPQECL